MNILFVKWFYNTTKGENKMNEKKPKLTDALYKGHSVPEILSIYEEVLKKTGNLIDMQHATFISQYKNVVMDKKFLATLRRHFNNIYKLIDKEFPETRFHLEGRRKSLLSTEKKIIKCLEQNKSLDTLRDLIAFRLIIFDDESQKDAVNKCYEIMQRIIEYGIENGFMLCEANPVEETKNFDNSKHNLYIPETSGIPKEFQVGVKDYILKPKENGYQSLHAVFRLASGHCFEVQIRTFSMHTHAESGDANHENYKQNEYKRLEIDKTKIHIPGYTITEDGIVYDMVGIEKALLVLQRQKTY